MLAAAFALLASRAACWTQEFTFRAFSVFAEARSAMKGPAALTTSPGKSPSRPHPANQLQSGVTRFTGTSCSNFATDPAAEEVFPGEVTSALRSAVAGG